MSLTKREQKPNKSLKYLDSRQEPCPERYGHYLIEPWQLWGECYYYSFYNWGIWGSERFKSPSLSVKNWAFKLGAIAKVCVYFTKTNGIICCGLSVPSESAPCHSQVAGWNQWKVWRLQLVCLGSNPACAACLHASLRKLLSLSVPSFLCLLYGHDGDNNATSICVLWGSKCMIPRTVPEM